MQKNIVNIFKISIVFLFIVYMTLFTSGITGFYEYQNKQKKDLTEEQIKKFEEDIKNGVAIDLEQYIDNGSKNYQNNFSSLGSTLSNTVSKIVSSSVDKTFDTLIKFVEQ